MYRASMTKRVTVSLPDHVAARLELEPNASSYVTGAIEGRMRAERVRRQLEASGLHVTDAGLAQVRDRLAALDAEWTPQRRKALREQRHRRVRDQINDPT